MRFQVRCLSRRGMANHRNRPCASWICAQPVISRLSAAKPAVGRRRSAPQSRLIHSSSPGLWPTIKAELAWSGRSAAAANKLAGEARYRRSSRQNLLPSIFKAVANAAAVRSARTAEELRIRSGGFSADASKFAMQVRSLRPRLLNGRSKSSAMDGG